MKILRRGAEAIIYKRTAEGVQFLVIRHITGMHAFVSGGMKRGEAPEQCLRRELQEEIGLSGNNIISVRDMGSVSSFVAHWFFVAIDFRYHDFLIEARNTFEPRRSLEVRCSWWFDYRAALADLSGKTRRALFARICNVSGLAAS